MATSGTYVFDATTDQILTSAFRRLNRLSEEQTLADLPTVMTDNARFVLNVLLKALESEGMPLWAISTAVIPYSSFVGNLYSFGSGSSLPVPLKLLQAQSYSNTFRGNSLDMTVMTQYDFNTLSNSNSTTGTPVNVYYQPLNGSGNLYVWPAPAGQVKSAGSITINYQRASQDAGIGTNTLDFPPYWTQPIISGLTLKLSGEYGYALADRNFLRSEYMQEKMDALSFGTEEGSFRIEPDWSYRG